MSLAQLFYLKETFRENLRRWRRNQKTSFVSRRSSFEFNSVPSRDEALHASRFTSDAARFTLETLEPRVLLSATPLEVSAEQALEPAAVTVPHGNLPSLDVDLNGQADALSDGILAIRHLFGFTGGPLTTGVVDPAGLRTTASALESYLGQSQNSLLDVDGNGLADALTDGIVIIRSLFGFTGEALIDGVVDPAGTRNTATAIETFLAGFLPGSTTAADSAAEPTGSAASPTVSPATSASTAAPTSPVVATETEGPQMDLSLAYVQRSWLKDFVAGSAGATDGEDEELLIALPA